MQNACKYLEHQIPIPTMSYWNRRLHAVQTENPAELIFAKMPTEQELLRVVVRRTSINYDTLMSIDFQTVDVIAICYDGTDYLEGHRMSDLDNDTNIETFTGNLEAGIELIQQTYPEIRIIVMSPPYAYAIGEDGSYKSSDLVCYNDEGPLSSYVISEGGICGVCSVSFVDNLYGTIHEDIASDYLTDNLHLNLKGRKLMAERFVYALNKYNK